MVFGQAELMHEKTSCAEGSSPCSVDPLDCCALCELRCGANRRAGETGRCGLVSDTRVYRRYVSFAEELDLSPALMLYLGGCNLRCRFCTQAPRCFQPDEGVDLTSPGLVEYIEAMAPGVRWINWVGGEPSLHASNLIELRQRIPTSANWLLNTNGYFTRECFELIDRWIDLYVVDFKFGTDMCADSLAGVPGYVAVLQRNLKDIYATGPQRILIRHLLIPGHERCCLEPIVDWVAGHLPGVRFHVMGSYVPGLLVMDDRLLGRTVSAREVARAEQYCKRIGLNLVA